MKVIKKKELNRRSIRKRERERERERKKKKHKKESK